jgi:Cu(I)/Ag(I) efflux system membrane fusion protein
MRTIHIAALVVAGFLTGSVLTFWVGRADEKQAAAPASPDESSPEREVLYWYDPMVPQHRFDRPGKSPFMDMQLVPKYADESADTDGVSIDSRLIQSLGVRTARATMGHLRRTVRANGTVAYDERAVDLVSSPVAAIVDRLHVRATLDRVDAGEPLVTLLAPEWVGALEEYRAVLRGRAPGLESLRDAARRRLVLLGIPEARIRAVESGDVPSARLSIAAPRGGVVTELGVREGASVAPGTVLMRINGLDPVWIEAAVPERDAARIRTGTPVRAAVRAHPERAFEGAVDAMLSSVDASTRTLTARIVLPNPDGELVPGMFADVSFEALSEVRHAVLVPTEAVIDSGERQTVIVKTGEGRFRAQEVRIGAEADGQTEVLEGIADGDVVVMSGQFLIDSEASLSGALTRLEGTGANQPQAEPREQVAQPARHEAEGTIEAIDGRTITIATGRIRSLDMPPMSMDFVAPAALDLPELRAGDRVAVVFVQDAAIGFRLLSLEKANAGAGDGR